MDRQLLASSAALLAMAGATASATIWVLLTQPARAVVALSNGEIGEFLFAVMHALANALMKLFELL